MPNACDILLVVLYCLLFSFIILKNKFFGKFLLSQKLVATIFLVKVFTGIAYTLVHYYAYGGGDTFGYFNESKVIFNRLPDEPVNFLRLAFGFATRPPDPAISKYAFSMHFYTEMSSYFMVRINALMRLVSFNSYYVNVVIYNFLTLFGILFLFRFLSEWLPGKKYFLLIILFLFPSVAFWSSGLHKDGIALCAVGFILQCTQKIIHRKVSFSGIALLLIGCWLLFVIRNYLLLLLIPCLLGFVWSARKRRFPELRMLGVFLGFWFIVFNLKFINPLWDVMKMITKQQDEFADLTQARTTIPVPKLLPNAGSLLCNAPSGIDNCVVHPTLFEIFSPIQLSSAIDNALVMLLIFAAVFFGLRKKHIPVRPFFFFCLLFSLSIFIIVGTTVPNLGAMVRYRMPGTLFLAAGLLCFLPESFRGMEKISAGNLFGKKI